MLFLHYDGIFAIKPRDTFWKGMGKVLEGLVKSGPQLSLAVDVLLEVEVIGRVARLSVHANLKMQMGRCGSACLSYKRYHLPRFYMLSFFDQILRIV